MPPTTTVSSPSPRLICLCASRIRTSERLRYLRYFLTSVSEQTTTDFRLFLGISFDTPELRKEFDALLAKTLPATIHVFLFSKRQSQFERYHSIFERLHTKKHITPDEESSTYICFADDDDLWAPYRMYAYRQGADVLDKDPRKPPFSFNITHFDPEIEVQNLSHWSMTLTDSKNTFQMPVPREYSDILCTHAVFAKWFTVASPELLANVICDLAFTRWVLANFQVKNDRQEPVYLRINSNLPLYWYRLHPQGSAARQQFEIEDAISGELLHERLVTHNMRYSKEQVIDRMLRGSNISRAGWLAVWRQSEGSPLWRHIFSDLLGEGR